MKQIIKHSRHHSEVNKFHLFICTSKFFTDKLFNKVYDRNAKP